MAADSTAAQTLTLPGQRRIEQLETALMRRHDEIEQLRHALLQQRESPAGKFAGLLERCFDRALPRTSSRRRWARTCWNACKSLVERLVRRPLASLYRKPLQDHLALDLLQYARWQRSHEPNGAELEAQRRHSFGRKPTISIAVPVYNTPRDFLDKLIESVRAQTYARWELCLLDGASTAPHVAESLAAWAAKDQRIHVRRLEQNFGIAGNTNAAIELASGEYIAFVDHDDELAPFALHEVVKAINEQPAADVLYSDEDKLDPLGQRVDPCFKPDWSPDTLRSHNYICHLLVVARPLVNAIGGVRAGFEGAQDYDFVLRATERAKCILHVPQVLYHWRMHAASTAANTGSKQYFVEAGQRALAEHLERQNTRATVVPIDPPGNYRVQYALPRQPLVSILIPNRDQVQLLSRCVEKIQSSSYANFELLVLENHSREAETKAYYQSLIADERIRILPWTRPFNYAAINNFGATHAKGELLLCLNNDVEAIGPDWLDRLVAHALRPEIGAVGAKLLYCDDTVQHAGIILGMGGVAGHAHLGFPREAEGYMQRLQVTHNCSAVTGACLLTRRDVFDRVGGFDERFVLAYNDVDLCLQIRESGYRILMVPEVELYHLESKTRGYEDDAEKIARFQREYALFEAKWQAALAHGDPYYNANFRLDRADYALRA